MTTIEKGRPVVTLINVFTVAAADQANLVAVLTEATQQVMRTLPGFVSANIHRGWDGTRVTNYAQWRSVEDFRAMLKHPLAEPHMREAAALATSYDPQLYEVSVVHHAGVGDAA